MLGGRARVRGSRALHPVSAAPGKWPWSWDLRVRTVRGVEVGGFERLSRLPGPRAWPGTPAWADAFAPPTRSNPPRIEASPILVGKARQRWHALVRPEGISSLRRVLLGDNPERSGHSVPPARRCQAFLFLRLCEEGAAAILVNPSRV